jgi:hypothetical protein
LADYTTDKEKDEGVPEEEKDKEKDEGVPEEEKDEELSYHRTTSPSTVQEVNNNRTTEEQKDEEVPHEETEEQVHQHLTTPPSTLIHSNNNIIDGGANGFNISDIPLVGKENPSTRQPQQTTAPSPFMVTNNISVEPNNIWRPASLKISGMPDHPDIKLMSAYTLPPNPKIKYDLLGPTETRSIWLPPAVYPPHWDQKQIVFDAIVKAAKDQ